MANILGKQEREQVVALGQLGWPLRRIEKATGVRRETAGRYLKAAGIAVRPPGQWGNSPPKAAKEASTDLSPWPRPGRSPQASACELYREWLEEGLGRGRTAMAMWQDLVDGHGFEAGYASVRRFVAKLRGESGREAHPVIETAPGEEGQVDYGDGPMVRHPETGKYRRPRMLVLGLPCAPGRRLYYLSSGLVDLVLLRRRTDVESPVPAVEDT